MASIFCYFSCLAGLHLQPAEQESNRQDAKEGFVIIRGRWGTGCSDKRKGCDDTTVLAKGRQNVQIKKDADPVEPINIMIRVHFIKTATCLPAPSATPLRMPHEL